MVQQENDEGHMKATPGGLKRKAQVQFCVQIYTPGKLAPCSSKNQFERKLSEESSGFLESLIYKKQY